MKNKLLILFFVSILPAKEILDSIHNEWWKTLNDSSLIFIVNNTVQENKTLQSLRSKIKQMDAQSKVVRSQLLPSIYANGIYSNGDLNGYAGVPSQKLPDYSTMSSLTLDGQYRLDSWGQSMQQYKGAKYLTQATIEDYKNNELEITTKVVGLYLDAIYTKKQIDILNKQKETSQKLLELTKNRYTSGVGKGLSYLQQKQQLITIEASIEPAILQYKNSLEYLSAFSYLPVDTLKSLISSSLPTLSEDDSLVLAIDKRPDIKSAELRELSAEANLKKTKLVTVPVIAINGSIGYDYGDPGTADWEKKWAVGAKLTMPIFTGGAIVSGLREAKAQKSSATETKEQIINTAKAELQNSITEEQSFENQLKAFTDQYEITKQVYEEAVREYSNGFATYLDVLTAISTLQNTEITVLKTKRNLLQSKLKVIKATGANIVHK